MVNQGGQEQINLQVPFELSGESTTQVVVTNNGLISPPVTVAVSAAMPGIFTVNGKAGAILKSDYSLNNLSNPAHPGDIIIIYATGLGPVSPTVATGTPASTAAQVTIPTSVTIGGLSAKVIYAGLAPSFVGLYQINVIVPSNTTSGNAVPVVITTGTSVSNTATIVVVGSSVAP